MAARIIGRAWSIWSERGTGDHSGGGRDRGPRGGIARVAPAPRGREIDRPTRHTPDKVARLAAPGVTVVELDAAEENSRPSTTLAIPDGDGRRWPSSWPTAEALHTSMTFLERGPIATGSATAALTALLAELRGMDVRLRVLQGEDMGRPSTLLTRAVRDGQTTRAYVGGRCATMFEGTFELS
ncbi:PhzF family phenazine biosynthesis protein [Lichenifustis flavocetrariae]|uniref:PhzF family phenazine biosynthesis protein n=1 Tax=Lichenifustis flavocetrariae TaxID=2949735 RepID=A0AA42CMP3_9HYPH|nr:PhzF family phenazine biosynthesis protein [Lichenifustis flavocetrariae]MCW6512904.1 PhzF family phenazine biosynthesis protein [Lichenifustis flavocetrariae]